MNSFPLRAQWRLGPAAHGSALAAAGRRLHGTIGRTLRARATRRLAAWLLVASATAAWHGPASALPMGHAESWMLMLDSTPSTRSLAANYAIAQTWAPGATLRRWEEPAAHGASLVRESAGLSLTHRLHRWNLPHAQANLWLVGDAGQLRRAGGHGHAMATAGTGGYGALAFMADYETTRVYFGGSVKALRGEDKLRHDVVRLRTGFSFWEAEYEGIQPWLLVEAESTRYSPGAMHEDTLITPMLRFIHRRWFVEVGVNREGGMFNLMFNH